jgi:hypothetical protein
VLVGVLDTVAAELKSQQALTPPFSAALEELNRIAGFDRPLAPFSCEPDESLANAIGSADFDPFQFADKIKSLGASLRSQ